MALVVLQQVLPLSLLYTMATSLLNDPPLWSDILCFEFPEYENGLPVDVPHLCILLAIYSQQPNCSATK
jgi:hypothetical protein